MKITESIRDSNIVKKIGNSGKVLRILTSAGYLIGALLMAFSTTGLGWLVDLEGRGSGWMVVSGEKSFTKEGLKDLEHQGFVLNLWPLESARFSIFGSLGFGTSVYGTELFLDGLPEEALDSVPSGWGWKQGDLEVPLIISREFLGLYNFGFAPSRGLPLLKESQLTAFPLYFRFRGPGGEWQMPGKILGLTDRYTTILAPVSFIREANRELAAVQDPPALRIALRVTDPGDPAIAEYLKIHGLSVNKELLRASEFVGLVRLILGALLGFSFLMILLAAGMLFLGIRINFEKNQKSWATVLLFGASPSWIKRVLSGLYLKDMVAISSVYITVSALVIWAIVSPFQSLGLNIYWVLIGSLLGLLSLLTAQILADRTIKKGLSGL